MCGIGGVLQLDAQPPAQDLLERMSFALIHRGPDGSGLKVLGPCGLVHRRLAIIDLSETGRQPMSTDDGQLWISYNGEIYNYPELKAELLALGFRFRSESDTEVILHAYRAWGEAAFARFNGMWALALWDDKEKRLLLSRDRLGVKPLYIHRSGNKLLFASEVKALLAAEPALAQADPATLARFLRTASLCFLGPSFFRGIEALPAGSNLVIQADGTSKSSRFWGFEPQAPRVVSMSEAAEQVRELLIDSVRLRFRSDVPVGTCLSGGIDSSGIVSIAKKKLGYAPEAFSAVYADPEYSETSFVRLMVKELDLVGHEVAPDGGDIPEALDQITYYQDGPSTGPGHYSQWQVMKLAAGRVKVLLDGQGGDELFAGYFHNFLPYTQSLLRRSRSADVEALLLLWQVYREVEPLTGSNPITEQLERRWRGTPLRRTLGATWRRLRGRDGVNNHHKLISPELETHPSDSAATPAYTGDPLTDVLWDETVRTSLPGLLHNEDRNSMAHSIEARVPFLDYRLVEYAFTLPFQLKIRGAETKAVLREALREILPNPIRQRRDKKGYPTPFATWIRGQHKDWLRDLVLSKAARERGYTRAAAVERLVDEHLRATADHSWALWRLATLELFARRFLDRPFSVESRA